MASRFISPTLDVGPGAKPASGAKLNFFETGTSTPKDTFTTAAADIPNANPVISDSNGVFPDIFISGTYKVILTTKDDVQTGFGEKDPVISDDSQTFDNVVDLVASRLSAGTLTKTIDYSSTQRGGGAEYLIKTAAQATTDGDIFSASTTGNLLLANGNVAVLQISNSISVPTFGGTLVGTQEAIDRTGISTTEINRGSLSLDTGSTLNLSGVLEIDKKNLKLEGNNAVIQWTGTIGLDMIHVTDSSRCTFKDFAILGDLNAAPFAAFHFEAESPAATLGTNENTLIEGVIIGRRWGTDTTTGGSADVTPAGLLTNGIVIDGAIDGNNDEYIIRWVQIHSCSDTGIKFSNFQSIWSSIENTLTNDCDVGIELGCNMTLWNPTFNRNKTVDIIGTRNIEVNIYNLQGENSEVIIRSNSGASFFVTGGKVLRNDATPSTYFDIVSGGSLVVSNLLLINVIPTFDTIKYRAGSAKGGIVKFRDCTIDNSDLRNTWDIDTGGVGAASVEIDIELTNFIFKTKGPYLDRTLVIPSIGSELSTSVSMGSSVAPLGTYFNTAYAADPQDLHFSHMITAVSVPRAVIFNPTGGAVDLSDIRTRMMTLDQESVGVGSKAVTPGVSANGSGELFTIPVGGVKLGDFVAWTSSVAIANQFLTAYASAEDEVTIVAHNATGGPNGLPATTFSCIKLKEFGHAQGSVVYTPVLIGDGANIVESVPVADVILGSHVFVAYTKDLQGLIVTGHVNTPGNVEVVISNRTGAGVTLAAGSFRVMIA